MRGRALSICAARTLLVIPGILLGLSHGPEGVALGYSTALTLVAIPIVAWSKLGTGVRWVDLWTATKPAFVSGLLGGAAGLLVKLTLADSLAPISCLLVGVGLIVAIYTGTLLFVMNQKHVYMGVVSHLWPRIWSRQAKGIRPEPEVSPFRRTENYGTT
jgi:hypothetical protein